MSLTPAQARVLQSAVSDKNGEVIIICRQRGGARWRMLLRMRDALLVYEPWENDTWRITGAGEDALAEFNAGKPEGEKG